MTKEEARTVMRQMHRAGYGASLYTPNQTVFLPPFPDPDGTRWEVIAWAKGRTQFRVKTPDWKKVAVLEALK